MSIELSYRNQGASSYIVQFKNNNKMANKSSAMQSWQIFIHQLAGLKHTTPQFPKNQILSFLTKQQCPPLKQLLTILPQRYKQYNRNPIDMFHEVIVLIYVLFVKGSNSRIVYQIAEEFLTELLRYRIIIILANQGKSQILSVYYYLDELLQLAIVKLLKHEESITRILTNSLKNGIILQEHNANKTSHKKQTFGISSSSSVDHIMMIFHGLVISKISSELTIQSNEEFKRFIQHNYVEQYSNIFGYLCGNEGVDKEQEIKVSDLLLLRENQESPYIQSLILRKSSHKNKFYLTRLTQQLTQQHPNNQWVIKAYYQAPQSIAEHLLTLSSKPTIQIYKFLGLVEIFGSSPKIQILNDYLGSGERGTIIQEQEIDKFLEFFSQFLMGEPLVSKNYHYGNSEWNSMIDESLRKLKDINSLSKKIIVNQIYARIKESER